jgi:hypothetical protein
MRSPFKTFWFVILGVLIVLIVAEAAMLVLLMGESREIVDGTAASLEKENSDDKAKRNVTRSGLDNSYGTVPNGDALIDSAVRDKLDSLREEKRERFLNGLKVRIEKKTGRFLTPTEQDALIKANSEYFFVIDDHSQGGEQETHPQRVGAAVRARLEYMIGTIGAEGEAALVLRETLEAL